MKLDCDKALLVDLELIGSYHNLIVWLFLSVLFSFYLLVYLKWTDKKIKWYINVT